MEEKKLLCKYKGEDVEVVIDKYDIIAIDALGASFDVDRYTCYVDVLTDVRKYINSVKEQYALDKKCLKDAVLRVFGEEPNDF